MVRSKIGAIQIAGHPRTEEIGWGGKECRCPRQGNSRAECMRRAEIPSLDCTFQSPGCLKKCGRLRFSRISRAEPKHGYFQNFLG